MLAQSITPIVVGLIMSFGSSGIKFLYIYAAGFSVLALIAFLFVKQAKVKYEKKKGLENLASPEDN